MLIRKIRFDHLKFHSADDDHRAVVIFTTDRGSISLLARAPLPSGAARQEVAVELVRDAVRQVRRMPEFRQRHEDVGLAPDALPSRSTMA
ncbi:hypothetical protein K1T73_00405 [Roseovarius sp. SCSIO 43702]|uniref:hypothetical protein n=1 Tax=Roseovarius sp. SCSIO 43702 TaxID=2823043 RepID=UPI001C734CC1|nr:hypothetical protein [Roseovarius sp. SCSIO 43702]QYX56917.1 hypothetical protein K1T73_00405 [Roseovarius sp. SCSIO 43702]